jgi:hypothetical protein
MDTDYTIDIAGSCARFAAGLAATAVVGISYLFYVGFSGLPLA